ncbi:hypothetical protein CTAYLR_002466 [Chrysophaeum taylorii]|uniref:Uncharacterized protein n=1 Tax=Chrysophaeum taylorii TaxID=2483200 RepID=A0AAD7UML5_9STRA|nr:hypothetical protein CTAYLR_002466 [Chrysophaeum taylorii]
MVEEARGGVSLQAPGSVAALRLRGWVRNAHLAVGVVHLTVLMALIVLWGTTNPNKVSVHLLQETFQHKDPSRRCECQPVSSLESLGVRLNVYALCITFSVMVVFTHTFFASDGFFTGIYTECVDEGKNPFRWFEYSVTSTSMLIIVALLSGVRQRMILVMMVVANIATMLQGYVIEAAIANGAGTLERIIPLVAGWGLFISCWYPVMYSWYETLDSLNDIKSKCKGVDTFSDDAEPPRWVEVLIVAICVMFVYFGIVSFVQVCHSFYVDDVSIMRDRFIFYEIVYITLSLVVKTVLNVWAMASIFSTSTGLAWVREKAAADGEECVGY